MTLSGKPKVEESNSLRWARLESSRKDQYVWARTLFFVTSIGIYILIYLRAEHPEIGEITGITVMSIFFGACVFMMAAESFPKKLRKEILPIFIDSLWPGSSYKPFGGIPQHEFEASKIFLYEINDYYSANFIETHSENPDIKLSSVNAAYHPYGAKGFAKIFQGLFLIADFNKHTSGRTYVLPDNAERLLGQPGQELQSLVKSHGELVKTEDREFEKYFVVYSTDQTEARYVLSTSLMQHLLEFRKAVNTDVFASFIDGKMYLGISGGTMTHSLKLSTPITPDLIKTLSPHLSAIHRLIQDSLTIRIWTKT